MAKKPHGEQAQKTHSFDRSELRAVLAKVAEPTESLLTFQQVLGRARAAKTKLRLLLGNGFSMAYDPERFSFTTLLESAIKSGVIQKDSEIHQVFQQLVTSDFENIMRALKDAEKIAEVYGSETSVREKIRTDAERLKGYLVQVITNNHPEKSTSLSDLEKRRCLAFIEDFDDIYTINYDLLLYWATMLNPSVTTDGFGDTEDSLDEGYVVYRNSGSYRIHYLHGALHYYDDGDEIKKRTYTHTDIPLVAQIRSSLDEGKYPIFVSEGTSSQKMAKIIHNGYLNSCYKSLKNIGGDLVIFGTTLESNDEHILRAILNSSVKNIYLGVSSLEKGRDFELKVDEYNKTAFEKKKKTLHLYDYQTVDVWGKKHES